MMATRERQFDGATLLRSRDDVPSEHERALLEIAAAQTRRSQRATAMLAAAGESLPDARWYGMIVTSQREIAVDNVLHGAGFSHWAPVEKVKQRVHLPSGKTISRLVDRAVITGYVFVRARWTGEACNALMGLTGVIGMVGGKLNPVAIGEAELVGMKGFFALPPKQRQRQIAKARALKSGDGVIIEHENFEGLRGVVVAAPDGDTAWVLAQLFGRQVRISLPVANLEKAR